MEDFIASFIWGTIGLAIFVFGKKSDEMPAVVIGLIIMVLSYFLSALWLTVASLLSFGALYFLYRRD